MTDTPNNGSACNVVVEAHNALTPTERRRSPRRAFRPPVSVTLRDAEGFPGWRCEATLLNLSRHGMACRGATNALAPLDIGSLLRVHLDGEASSDTSALPVRVVALTGASDDDALILGVEFAERAMTDADRHTLERWLSQSHALPDGSSLA